MTTTDLPTAPAEDPPITGFDPSTPARVLLATLSAAAGVVHLAMVPSHMQEWAAEGIAFAVAGWLQVGLALLLVTRPSRAALKAGIVANLAFVAVWALSRTAGLPGSPHAGHPEAAGLVDLTTVGLQAAFVLASGIVLARPDLGRSWRAGALVPAAIVPVAVLALTTGVLASPSAGNHAHGAHGDHGDEVMAAGASGTGGSDHAHDATATGGGAADHHATGDGHGDHGAAAQAVEADARCDWEMNTAEFWSRNPPAAEDGSHEHGHGAGNGQGNEHGIQPWQPITDQAQCDQLQSEIDRMEKVARSMPTAQDALNAGCFRVTIYVAGIAAHYICPARLRDGLSIEEPEMLLYGGSQPWAPMVGLSYMSYGDQAPNKSPNAPLWQRYMTWHFHEGLCIKGGQVIGGDNSDQAKCEANGGRKMGRTGYMGHYWLPECNSPDGVFSAANPRLDLPVANYNDDPANQGKPELVTQPCKGSQLPAGDDRFERPDGDTESAAGR